MRFNEGYGFRACLTWLACHATIDENHLNHLNLGSTIGEHVPGHLSTVSICIATHPPLEERQTKPELRNQVKMTEFFYARPVKDSVSTQRRTRPNIKHSTMRVRRPELDCSQGQHPRPCAVVQDPILGAHRIP